MARTEPAPARTASLLEEGGSGPVSPAETAEPRPHWRPDWLVPGLAVLLLVLLLGLFGAAVLRRQGPATFAGFGVNAVGKAAEIQARPASDFVTESFGGGTLRLSDYRGQVVVLNFWASWCPPCREEARTLAAAAEDHADRGVVFVGVNVWDSDADARAFLERYGMKYPNGPDRDGRIAIDYGVTGLPETFLISAEGTLVRRWIGPLTRQQLDSFIEGRGV